MLNFLKRVQRLSWIERCSNTQHIKPYSVAQHSFYISLYGIIFASVENERRKENYYDIGLVAQKCLVHDLEESETGDILFPLHNNYPEFKDKLDFIRNSCIREEVFKELSPETKAYFSWLWRASKDNTPEGRMVACMDKFEILVYAVGELAIGNRTITTIYENAIKIIKEQFSEIESVINVIEEIEEEYWEVDLAININ
jgi:5'-deoxynucleotidase YfbR-like HD superfamily hydrolase